MIFYLLTAVALCSVVYIDVTHLNAWVIQVRTWSACDFFGETGGVL
jgi:hypothetical protein